MTRRRTGTTGQGILGILLTAGAAGCGETVVVDSQTDGALEHDGVFFSRDYGPNSHSPVLEIRVGSPPPPCTDGGWGDGLAFGGAVAIVTLDNTLQKDGEVIQGTPDLSILCVGVFARPGEVTSSCNQSGEVRVGSITPEQIQLTLAGIGVFPPPADHPKATFDFDRSYRAGRCP